ncbi:ATP-binding protein [Patescibacteria group bacterium]|nr:ATP-binding protein [Patescibacteria group bacterium]
MTLTGPARLSEVLDRVVAKLPAAERLAAQLAEANRQFEAAKLAGEIDERRKRLWESRGRRYAGCTLENFQAVTPDQRVVVERLRAYRGTLAEKVEAGVGLVLTGPSGTGKDHLLAGLFDAAISAGLTLQWTSGPKLCIRFRDRIGNDEDERRTIRQYTDPDVLVISDPMPMFGALTNYQAQVLYEIGDTRANAMRPTWVTINAKNRQEADGRLGPQIVRRLSQDAISLACNWEPYKGAQTR